MEKLLREIRDQMLIQEAYDLRQVVTPETPSEDLMNIAPPGEPEVMRLTMKAALREAIQRHRAFSLLIDELTEETSKT